MYVELIANKNGIRLDQYLAEALDISRSKIQKLIKEGKITIADAVVSASDLVKEGQVIEIDDDLTFEIHIEGEDIPLSIVYEDEELLVVDKKSGMVVHPAPGNYQGTLVNALIHRFSLSNGSDSIRPGIVHRIDKDTSGLLVVAKNEIVHEKLSKMIQKKEVERTYWALVDGVIPHATGTIEAPIGRDPDDRQKMTVTDIHGKDAVTHFKVLKRYEAHTLIECKLETGRTHQIRVHMKYIGYPIYNDPIYGKRKQTSPFGQFLHSKSLKFQHPTTGQELCFESRLPVEFENFLEELEKTEK